MNKPSDYIGQFWIIHLDPLPSDVPGNGILYTVTWWLLTYFPSNFLDIISFHKKSGKYTMTYLPDDHRPASHDNITPIVVSLALHNEHGLLKEINPFDWPHPRDFIFIGYVQKRWWAYPLLPILLGIFIYMALNKYKYRPTPWKWVKDGFPKRSKIFKTDGELLYWIRLQLPKEYRFIHWTKYIIEPILRRKYKSKDWARAAREIYYPDGHPCRI